MTNKNKDIVDTSKSEVYNINKFTSEAGHWYDREGLPAYTIVGANGKERNTTLRDAKKEGLVPSVTTILNLVAKPSLENWKINKALEASVALKKTEKESVEEFIYRCKTAQREIGQTAASQGTKIHALIEKGFEGKSKNKSYFAVKAFLDQHFPNEKWIAEDSFCSEKGYGGKIDLYSKSGIFVDFKTKDNLVDKEPAKLVYDEHGMQLSAYAEGCGFSKPERVSIFVDRQKTDLVLGHIWDKESHIKHIKMFESLLTYWKLVKNYDSAVL
tara:strand:+ start:7761 stop:8573 length:813 start_codon:yes stop_codon:yes gene_type:complete